MPFRIIDNRRESRLLRVVSPDGGGVSAVAKPGLEALASIYESVMSRKMESRLKMPKKKVDAMVVSVGNITVGGTGKTPVCLYIAELLKRSGMKTGIATRGYGRKSSAPLLVTAETKNISWREAGDEPVLYLHRGDVAAIAVDVDRHRGAATLVEKAGCGGVLLDDGFQFVTLHRDLNIAVLDAGAPFGNGKLLPAGPLRESAGALARADMFWLTRADAAPAESLLKTKELLYDRFTGVPVVESAHEPAGFHDAEFSAGGNGLDAGMMETRTTDTVAGIRAATLCAIGNPEPFERQTEEYTGSPILAFRFSDHHPFTAQELKNVEEEAIREGCAAVITTEKDEVRLPAGFMPRLRWLALRINIRIISGREHLHKALGIEL
jgi:tetraacyldisaccharide-1-P 4'-kinase